MRDLINKLMAIEAKPVLAESVGLARRKAGDIFTNPEGKTLTFNSLNFYPERGSFSDTDAIDLTLKQVQQNLASPIQWTNKQGKNLGFGIAHFTDDTGQDVYIGRYFSFISASRLENKFPHNAIPGKFNFSSKVGKKEHAGYKPSEILTKFDNLSPTSLYEQVVAKFGEQSDEARAFSIFLAARNFPVKIPLGNMNPEAFKQYFCEMLQPVAFIKGMKIEGADEGIAAYIGKTTSLAGATISFNPGATGGLNDSILTAVNGKVIKISTKEGAGAMASTKNLIDALGEIDSTKYGKTIRKQYPEEIRVIEILQKGTHYTGPLELAKFYDIINDSEMQQVMNIRAKKLGLDDNILDQNLISKRLENWYRDLLASRKKNEPVVPHHALMFIIAGKVCDYVNNKTQFGRAGSDILNHSAVLQVYTNASVNDKHIIINSFTADFPGNAVTGLKLTYKKSYWTTGENGKITFKILKNNEKYTEPDIEEPGIKSVETEPELVEPGTQRLKIRPKGAIAKRDSVERGLGRERRTKTS